MVRATITVPAPVKNDCKPRQACSHKLRALGQRYAGSSKIKVDCGPPRNAVRRNTVAAINVAVTESAYIDSSAKVPRLKIPPIREAVPKTVPVIKMYTGK